MSQRHRFSVRKETGADVLSVICVHLSVSAGCTWSAGQQVLGFWHQCLDWHRPHMLHNDYCRKPGISQPIACLSGSYSLSFADGMTNGTLQFILYFASVSASGLGRSHLWNETEIKLKQNNFVSVLFQKPACVKRNWNKTLKQLWNVLDLFQSCFRPRLWWLFQHFVSHVRGRRWNKTEIKQCHRWSAEI